MLKLSTQTIFATLLTGLMSITANSAMAQTPWQAHHGGRAEVNHRLNHQDHRIRNEVRRGEISRYRAHQLHKQDHQIRREERIMASQHHGHLTRQEHRTLNHQENALSHRIGR
jgi:hypothetical protein